MRDRLFHYLQTAGRPLPADQVLREALHITSPNSLAAHRVLKSIVKGDARFRCGRGLWRVQGGTPVPRTSPMEPAALFVEQARGSRDALRIRGAVRAGEAVAEFGARDPVRGIERRELEGAAQLLQERTVAVWDSNSLRVWRRALQAAGLPAWEGDAVPLLAFLRRIFPDLPEVPSLEDAASRLGVPPPDPERPAAVAAFLGEVFSDLLGRTPPEQRARAGDLIRWITEDARVDFSRFAFGPEMLADLPESAGVYVMRDAGGDVLYVGKASNLRRRVRSYFFHAALRSAKIRTLHEQLHTLEVLPVDSEVEALILEMRLIRQLQPRVNVQAEVHEPREGYGRERNLILLVPHAEGDRAWIYFLRAGLFVDQVRARLGHAPDRALQARIRRIYFGAKKALTAGESSTSDREIILRWFARNRRNLNFIDVDDAGACDAVIRCVTGHLLDPGRLKTKVIYR